MTKTTFFKEEFLKEAQTWVIEDIDQQEFEEIFQQLGIDNDLKFRHEDGEDTLSVNVKGRPDLSRILWDITDNSLLEDVQFVTDMYIDAFVMRLSEQYKDFRILGRMGGYWGFALDLCDFELTERGCEELDTILNDLKNEIYENGDEYFFYETFDDNKDNDGNICGDVCVDVDMDLVIEDKDCLRIIKERLFGTPELISQNLQLSKEFAAKITDLNQQIDDEERFINDRISSMVVKRSEV